MSRSSMTEIETQVSKGNVKLVRNYIDRNSVAAVIESEVKGGNPSKNPTTIVIHGTGREYYLQLSYEDTIKAIYGENQLPSQKGDNDG